LFDSYSQAKAAVEALEQAGFTSSEISLVSRWRDDNTLVDDHEVSGTATGATTGAIVGGGGGLLAALGLIAIPGIGPLVAAGVLATTLVGAAGGSVVGGLIGALTDAGVSEEVAHVYSEGVRRGSSLVTVTTDEARTSKADSILKSHKPVDVRQRREAYVAPRQRPTSDRDRAALTRRAGARRGARWVEVRRR
jgi:uncharacterized membrane protein